MIHDAFRTVMIAVLTGVLFAASFVSLVVYFVEGEKGKAGECSPGLFQTQCE